MLAKTGVHHYSGNNIELGTACGKYYRVCTLAIIDPGECLSVCRDRGRPPHTGADPDPIVLPQCCPVALAFTLEDAGAQKELKTLHKNPLQARFNALGSLCLCFTPKCCGSGLLVCNSIVGSGSGGSSISLMTLCSFSSQAIPTSSGACQTSSSPLSRAASPPHCY